MPKPKNQCRGSVAPGLRKKEEEQDAVLADRHATQVTLSFLLGLLLSILYVFRK